MGVVFLGVHGETGEQVAVKTVHTPSPAALTSIRRELRALSRLRHPGIVEARASGSTEGVPWYAMRYLDGRTLKSYIAELWPRPVPAWRSSETLDLEEDAWGPPAEPGEVAGRVPFPAGRMAEVVLVARRMFAALAYLHAQGLMHRDIKPQNVVLVGDLQPVLVDFGLARTGAVGTSRERLSEGPRAAGTPDWIAPEVVRGDPVDARADLFAMGCVLFELLTGRRPFAGRGGGTSWPQLHVAAPRVDSHVEGVPAELDLLVHRLLVKNPARRLGHAADAVAVLQALEGDFPAAMPQRSETPFERPGPLPVLRARLSGRGELVAQLERRLAEALAGRGGLVVVTGRSGIGKTSVVGELARRVPEGCAVVTGTAVAVGPLQRVAGGLPLHPLQEFLQAVVDGCIADPSTAATVVGARGPILAPVAPQMTALAGPSGGAPLPVVDGAAARERLLAAVRDVAIEHARRAPTLLLLDDLQWADELTLGALQRLVDADLSGTPLLVVATCRDEEVGPAVQALLGRPAVERLAVDRIDAAAVRAMVRDITAVVAAPAGVSDRLTILSEGSPFYVTEHLRAAVGAGLIRLGAGGQAEFVTLPDGTLDLPGDLAALVRMRLDQLPPGARRVVNLACVMGRSFDEEVVPVAWARTGSSTCSTTCSCSRSWTPRPSEASSSGTTSWRRSPTRRWSRRSAARPTWPWPARPRPRWMRVPPRRGCTARSPTTSSRAASPRGPWCTWRRRPTWRWQPTRTSAPQRRSGACSTSASSPTPPAPAGSSAWASAGGTSGTSSRPAATRPRRWRGWGTRCPGARSVGCPGCSDSSACRPCTSPASVRSPCVTRRAGRS
jgi:hypothetical protein